MKKIVIYGSSSMAGHIISDYFLSNNNFIIKCITEDEIFNEQLMINNQILLESDYIINCIRCLVKESDSNSAKAIIYNSYFPHFLFNANKNNQTKIIHLSTDCVFLGDKGNYPENSTHDGISSYSKTKSLGEININNGKDIVIRTSYIGPTLGKNQEELFDWFLLQEKLVNGYCNALWNGITTLELAKSILKLIELDFSGTYHLTGSKKISKYSLLLIIKKIWGKKIEINSDYTIKIDRSLIDTIKLIVPKDYELMFNELHEYMVMNKSKYNKYSLFI